VNPSVPLPAGWTSVELGALAMEGPTNGYSGATGSDATGSPTLRLSATTSGAVILDDTTVKRLYETIPPDSALWLEPGDLLVQRSNTLDLVGTAAVYGGPPRTYIYPDLMMRLRFKHPETTAWVCRYINSSHGRHFIKKMAAGSSGSMPKISGAKLRQMLVPLPPLADQRRISEVMDRAEALRAKRRAALAQLDTLAQAIFLDMFGDPATNPKGWPDTMPLAEVAEIVSGVTKGRSLEGRTTRSVPYLAVANVQDRALDLSLVKTIEATSEEVSRYRLLPNDLLLTEGGDPDKLGRGTLWNGEIAECIHQNHIFRVRLTSTAMHPLFLNWLIGSQRGKRYFLRSAKQTTGIASINMSQLRAFPLIMPPIELQRDFARRVAAIEKLKGLEVVALAQLEAVFSSLQHRAFQGEL
jgi:type I restriction enzyme S subunit